MINKVNEVGKEKCLKLNIKKTKTFYVGYDDDYEPIKIDNKELERQEHFEYLGSTKTSNAYCSKDVNIRKQRMVELSTTETPLQRHPVLHKMQDYANIQKEQICSFFIFVAITSL